ncbi:hypothetical protein ACYFX5_09785 [Bremerella sp. T1]|uniref:hypothetical protein n=1 Tax=Bremerella sp. TYQ1 TaxID=3119568 RepID=UPI001CCB50FA|nr:hypothetical protein [Bremerella volcania]UBM38544.1 hypothetical protein LA756_11725 [Bremerella volcania]
MRLYLSLMTVFLLGVALLGAWPALFSVMIFDAPGSAAKPELWMLFLSVFSLPAVCVFAVVMAWKFYKEGNWPLARGAILLPTINLLGLAVAVLISHYW